MPEQPPPQAPAGPTAAARPDRPGWWSRHGHLVALLGLTVLAGLLRFHRIDRPLIWYDESQTFARTCGTWQDMFDRLRSDGFMPLHYIAYWWLGRNVDYMTPFWMRLLPALSGTLMVPAVYFLARQMVAKRVALTAAAFVAFSAYLLAFSRDAKMYMDSWLFVTVATAFLLWALNARRWWQGLLGWPLWLLTGAVAAWLNANSILVLALHPVLVLAGLRRPWWRCLLSVALTAGGLWAMLAGPYWYSNHVSEWNRRTGMIAPAIEEVEPPQPPPALPEEGAEPPPPPPAPTSRPAVGAASAPATRPATASRPWPRRPRPPGAGGSGLEWIPKFHEGRADGWGMLRHTAGAFLSGWEWPNPREWDEKNGDAYVIPRWTLVAFTSFLCGLVVALALGALPWPARWRGANERDPPPRPAWLTAFWLACWLVLPTYGYYCRSVDGFVAPDYWARAAWQVHGFWWLALLGGAGVVALALHVLPARWPGRTLVAAALLACLGTLGWVLWREPAAWFIAWGDHLRQPWLALPLTVLAPALLWHYCGDSPRRRLLKAVQALAVLLVVAGLCWALHAGMYHLMYLPGKARANFEWAPIWWPRYLGVVFPAMAVALAALLMRLPTWPLRWAVLLVVLGVNAGHALARIELDTDPPWDLIAQDLWHVQQTPRDKLHARLYAYRIQGRQAIPWPLDETIRNSHGRYQWCLAGRLRPGSKDYWNGIVDPPLRALAEVPPDTMTRTVARNPRILTLIVWEYWPAEGPPPDDKDRYLAGLGRGWSLHEVRTQRVFAHWFRISREWNWQQREWLVRRVYVRDPASTQPAPRTPSKTARPPAPPAPKVPPAKAPPAKGPATQPWPPRKTIFD